MLAAVSVRKAGREAKNIAPFSREILQETVSRFLVHRGTVTAVGRRRSEPWQTRRCAKGASAVACRGERSDQKTMKKAEGTPPSALVLVYDYIVNIVSD